jgi:hypothetical protein
MMSSKKAPLYQQLPRDLYGLPHNWDGYGAVPVTEKAIHAAEWIEFVPTVNGGIQIELHIDGKDLEFEIDAEGRFESLLFIEDKGGSLDEEVYAEWAAENAG